MRPTSPDFSALCAEMSFIWSRSTNPDDLFENMAPLIDRVRTALAEQPMAPIPVSERLPGPEDCNAEGKCWMFGNVEGDWRLISIINPGVPRFKYCFSHWLPANALPFPENND